MKYRVIFYKPAIDKHLIDNVISIGTKLWNWNSPGCSHVEGWSPDNRGRFYIGQGNDGNVSVGWTDWINGEQVTWPLFRGNAFTSTMRGDDNGTVIREMKEVLVHPERWFYYEIEISDEDYAVGMKWAEDQCAKNKGYAKRTLLKFIGINWADKERNICSQAVHNLLVEFGVLPEPFKIPSPRRLASMLEAKGYERIELK
jgi:hypothetical protein